jgi:hypothetical protein
MQGMEMALRGMGLGSVLDAAKQLAESGAVGKLIAFADEMEGLRDAIKRIEAAQAGPCAQCPARAELAETGRSDSDNGA